MPEATVKNHANSVQRTAAADLDAGTIAQEAGLAGVVAGAGRIRSGDEYTVMLDVLAEVPSASATVFAEGATVQWDDTAKLAVASGDFTLGKAERAKSAGQTVVRVLFNK